MRLFAYLMYCGDYMTSIEVSLNPLFFKGGDWQRKREEGLMPLKHPTASVACCVFSPKPTLVSPVA
jgi:hypothetical protein